MTNPMASALFPITIALLLNISTMLAVETDSLLDTAKDLTGSWDNWMVNRKDGWYKSNSGLASGMVYSVCQVESDEALEFWLRSPFIDCRDARSVSVELRFTTRSCAKHPRPDGLKRCKETLDLMVLHSAGSAADASLAANLSDTFFTKAHTVAPDVKWEKNPQTDQMHKIINTKVFTFEVQRKGLYIALRDTGSCVSLVQVRVYFMACPQTVANLTVFDRTPAPHHSAADMRAVDLRTVRGRCVEGGELRGGPAPSRICRFNGQWFDLHNSGHCVCSAGRFAQAGTSCDPCPPNSYKSLAGPDVCIKCPDNSQAEAPGSASCACRQGFYRNAQLDSTRDACTKPPSAPRDAIVTENSRSRIVLSWSPPEDTGGRADIRYHVDCYGCGPGSIIFEPGPSVTERSVAIRGLQPLTRYTFHVYALNGVSELAGAERRAWRAVTVQTSASLPSKLEPVSARIINLTCVQFSWKKIDSSIEEFELKIFPKKDHSRPWFRFTSKETYLLENLDSTQTYLVQIRARTNLGWGEYSDAIAINTLIPTKQTMGSGAPVDDGKGDTSSSAAASASIIIGAVVAVLLCLIIVLAMIIFVSRRGFLFSSRRTKMMAEKQAADCSGMLPYSNNFCNTMPYSARAPFGLAYQLTQQQPHQQQQSLRSYVDPHTYEDPCQAVQEFAKEIDASWISIECVLGGGEFGDVCKGLLTVPGRLSQPVAVKTLKPGASDKNKLDFLTEASIMGQFDDPNVIYLEGVVTRSHPAMIVTEFMANGSLDTFLRSHDGELSCQQLVGMLRGIASGMRYLSDTGYIHRDLAARNILVSEQLVCKVADFGLSREIPVDPSSVAAAADAAVKDGTYTTRGGKIPIRWTAPEAIHFRKFTSATDVWSFGIVMWEVMSFGERPYWNWSNQDVIAAVENGYRLPPPMDCPESVHRMMLDCWKWDRVDRPKFGQLVKALDRLLRQPDLLLCQQPRPIYEAPSMSMPAQRCGTVAQWLAGMKLDCYADAFHRCGLVSMEQAPRLTASDLDAIGVNDSGHRRRLLHAVESLKMHIYEAAPYSDGYMV